MAIYSFKITTGDEIVVNNYAEIIREMLSCDLMFGRGMKNSYSDRIFSFTIITHNWK